MVDTKFANTNENIKQERVERVQQSKAHQYSKEGDATRENNKANTTQKEGDNTREDGNASGSQKNGDNARNDEIPSSSPRKDDVTREKEKASSSHIETDNKNADREMTSIQKKRKCATLIQIIQLSFGDT